MKRLAVAGALLIGLGAVAVASGSWRAPRSVVEPVAFDHKLHIEKEDLECTECHAGAEEGIHAGLPDIHECADCHERAKGEHPDEPKVREFASKDEFRTAVVDGVLGSEHPGSILGLYSITADGDTTLCAIQRYREEGGEPVPGEAVCPRD